MVGMFVQASIVPFYTPVNAGPILTPLPPVEGRPSFGLNYRLAHMHHDGQLGEQFEAAILSTVDGVAVIIEGLTYAVERARMVPALRTQQDRVRSSIRRLG